MLKKIFFSMWVLVSSGCISNPVRLEDKDFCSPDLCAKVDSNDDTEYHYNDKEYRCCKRIISDVGNLAHIQLQSDSVQKLGDGTTEECDFIMYDAKDNAECNDAVVCSPGGGKEKPCNPAALDFMDKMWSYEFRNYGRDPNKKITDEREVQCKSGGISFSYKPIKQIVSLNGVTDMIKFSSNEELKHNKQKGFFFDTNKAYTYSSGDISLIRSKIQIQQGGNCFAEHYTVKAQRRGQRRYSEGDTKTYHWKNIAGTAVVATGLAVGAWKLFSK